MAKKVFTDESLNTFVEEIKSYTDNAVSGKANSSHNHSASNITSGTLSSDRLPTVPIEKGGTGATTAADALTNLGITATATELNYMDGVTSSVQTQLDGKAASSHGTHVSYSSTAPVMDGTASVGSASTVARSDHKHPTDTTRASKTEFDTHVADTTKHITSTERTNWNAAKTHADSAHAPSNAEKNQNAFSNVKVGTTTIAADTTTDTLELVGSNVTITPDATNDKVTIAVADGSTSTKGVVQLTNSTSSTSTTTAATPSSVKSAYDLANTAKTNAATAQTRADNAYSLADSKVDSLSDLGITATAAELNYTDGVTSNIQTQIDSLVSDIDAIDWFSAGASIPTGSDLNTYTTVGKYYVGSESNAQSLTNCPTTTNFCMYVFVRTNGDSKTQMIIALNDKMYIRSCNSSGEWRDWRKYMTESDVIDNLESTSTTSPLSANQGRVLFQSVSDGKSLVASAITDKGVTTASDATFATMAANIESLKLGSGNATTADVLSGKTFTNSDGVEYTGAMTNNGAVTKTFTPSTASQTYTIPQGYHDGTGVVIVNAAPVSLINGDATAANVLSGKIFFSDSYTAKTGTMTNNGGTSKSATFSLDTTNSRVVATVPANAYYNTSSKLYASYSKIRSLIGLTAAKIVKGNTILGLAGTATAAPKSLSGTISAGKYAWGKVVEGTHTFSTAFSSVPTVQLTAKGGDHGVDYVKTTSVTKAGFNWKFEVAGTPDAGYSTITITWNAVV